MSDSETLIRKAYNLATAKDIPEWVKRVHIGGTFTDESTGVTYRGEALGNLVEIDATGFSDMHSELYRFYPSDHVARLHNTSDRRPRRGSDWFHSPARRGHRAIPPRDAQLKHGARGGGGSRSVRDARATRHFLACV